MAEISEVTRKYIIVLIAIIPFILAFRLAAPVKTKKACHIDLFVKSANRPFISVYFFRNGFSM